MLSIQKITLCTGYEKLKSWKRVHTINARHQDKTVSTLIVVAEKDNFIFQLPKEQKKIHKKIITKLK